MVAVGCFAMEAVAHEVDGEGELFTAVNRVLEGGGLTPLWTDGAGLGE